MPTIKDKISELIRRVNKKFDIVLIGLDNSGKTTISNYLDIKEGTNPTPTTGIVPKTFRLGKDGKVRFNIIDTAGQERYRSNWATIIPNVDAIIFVIDISDKARYEEAKKELDNVVNILRKNKKIKVPIVFAVNKIDLVSDMDNEIRNFQNFFKIDDFLKALNPYQIEMTSAIEGTGIYEMIRWLFSAVTRKEIKGEITFEDFMIFERGGNLLISNLSQTQNENSQMVFSNLLSIVSECIKKMSDGDSSGQETFVIKKNDISYIFCSVNDYTGVAITRHPDVLNVEGKLKDIMGKIKELKIASFDIEKRQKFYNQFIAQEITLVEPE